MKLNKQCGGKAWVKDNVFYFSEIPSKNVSKGIEIYTDKGIQWTDCIAGQNEYYLPTILGNLLAVLVKDEDGSVLREYKFPEKEMQL